MKTTNNIKSNYEILHIKKGNNHISYMLINGSIHKFKYGGLKNVNGN